jgi:chromosome segregation protein
MYLSRLEIFGFKTFAQKVDLHFDDGITDIVGPNGCGKSNIVDALRWSLGEQKSSVLRSEKMENVIFNGTKTRKPLNLAEVSLTIQNTKNILPTEYTEVTITRRIYRSGESEYFLNRLPCRLKDINDLFMDTGMGADAYSVIELKMVEQILSDNTDDRRKLFEEAAGITKYKIRRRQTFRKLETTKTDLMRANDIITEIEKKVNSLKRQTQKANRYTKWMGQLKREEIILAHHSYRRFTELIAPLEDQLANVEGLAEQLLGEIGKKESEVEAIQTSLIAREQKLREVQTALENHDREIKVIEEEMLVSRERKNNLQDLIRRYSEERTTLQEKRAALAVRIEEESAALQSLEAAYAARREALEAKRSDLHAFDGTIQERKAELERLRTELVQVIDELAKKRSAYQLTKNNIQNLERKISDINKENAIYSGHSDDASSQWDQNRSRQSEWTRRIEALNRDIASHQHQADVLKAATEEAKSKKSDADAELKTRHARMAIIQKAIENHEGFPESVQYLLQEKSEGLEATVADMISIEERFKKAAEAALGDSFSFLVAGKMESVQAALSKLGTSQKGVATFLNREKLFNFRSAGDLPSLDSVKNEILGFATDLARCEDVKLIQLLLGDVVFVENFSQATKLAERFPQFRFVTLHGEIVKGNYLIKGGSPSRSSDSIIGQRETLRRLQEQAGQFEKQMADLESQILRNEEDLKKTLQNLSSATEVLKASEQELLALDKEVSQSEYEHKRSKESLSRNADAIQQAAQELQNFQSALQDMDPQMAELENRRTALEVESRRVDQQVAELEKQRREKAEAFNDASSDFVRMEGEIKNHGAAMDSGRQQIEDNDATVAKHESETLAAQSEIARTGERTLTLESELKNLSQMREGIEKTRDAEETEVSKLRETAGQIEAELKKIRRQREDRLNSRHTLEQEHGDLRLEMRTLADRIQRDYDFDLAKDSMESLEAQPGTSEEVMESEAADEADESAKISAEEKNLEEVLDDELPPEAAGPGGFDAETARALIETLRRKIKQLGPVNMEAFAEYNSEKERLDILVQQRQDLLDAESQLLQTIATINTTAEKQFMEVFEKIRQNFISIFTSLFDNSEANLELAKDNDPLEASIDILARPTGKKIQHIALLSGGEKTLTAIALLFAIYLVKPSPFCILDEVDAPLDDSNIDKFTKILRDFSQDTQFIVVTHNKRTMEAAKNIFGITMQEAGVSKVVSVKFNNRPSESKSDDIEELIRENQVEELNQEIKEPPAGPASE